MQEPYSFYDNSSELDQTLDPRYELPKDAYYDMWANVPPHLIALKDALSQEHKASDIYTQMFSPENIGLNPDEFNQKQNESKVAPVTEQALQNTANLSDDQFLDSINKIRERVGQAPILPDDPALENPNWMQGLAAAIGSFIAPEFAMENAAIPYQYQLSEQAKAKDKAMQQYQVELDKYNKLVQLDMAEAEGLDRRDQLRYDVDTKRELMQKGQTFEAGENEKQRVHQTTLQQNEFTQQFAILDSNKKHDLAMSMVQVANNPNAPADMRKVAAENLKTIGIDFKAFEGKTYQEQGAELQNQLLGLEVKYSEGTLESRIGQEKSKWDQVIKQNSLLDKEIKWYDKKAQADIDNARANIANVYSLIGDRQFQQGFQLSEQQRAYLGGVQENILGSIRAMGTQIEANNSRLNNINTQLSKKDLPDEERKTLETERDSLIKQNTSLGQQSEGMQTQLDGFNEYFVERSGVSMGESGLGETYLGLPYSWGGGSLSGPSYGIGKGSGTKGFDCSGFTRAVAYQDFGVTLPRRAIEQWQYAEKNGMTVDLSEAGNLQTGDFCYFKTSEGYHTGIVVFKDGIPYLRNAPSSGQVIADKPLANYLKSMKLLGAARFGKQIKSPEKEKLDPQGGMPMGGG